MAKEKEIALFIVTVLFIQQDITDIKFANIKITTQLFLLLNLQEYLKDIRLIHLEIKTLIYTIHKVLKLEMVHADENLLYVANSERLEIVVLKKEDLSYVRNFGNEGVSRITGAKDAIKSVLSDSSILSQAQFGLGLWNGGKASFRGFNKSGGVPIFDSPKFKIDDGYMAVGINPKGTEQILNFLSTDFALHYGTHARGFANLADQYFRFTDLTINPHNKNLDCQTTAIILIGDGEWNADTHGEAVRKIRSLNRKNEYFNLFGWLWK